MARRRRRIGNMQHLVLDSLIPSKRDYAAGEFDYIGGAGRTNLDVQDDLALAKAREQWAAQGGKSNQPDPRKAFSNLVDMHRADPIPEDEVIVFSGGERTTLDERVYDLRAALRWAAIKTNQSLSPEIRRFPFSYKYTRANENRDRTGNRAQYWRVDPSFRISFMRAAAILVKHGFLICEDDDNTQLRFVSMRDDIERQCREEDEERDG